MILAIVLNLHSIGLGSFSTDYVVPRAQSVHSALCHSWHRGILELHFLVDLWQHDQYDQQRFSGKITTKTRTWWHYGTKPGHFETYKIHFPTCEGVSEVSERANQWAQQRARVKRAVRSKRTSEWCELTDERMDERVTQYLRLYSCLFQTRVDGLIDHEIKEIYNTRSDNVTKLSNDTKTALDSVIQPDDHRPADSGTPFDTVTRTGNVTRMDNHTRTGNVTRMDNQTRTSGSTGTGNIKDLDIITSDGVSEPILSEWSNSVDDQMFTKEPTIQDEGRTEWQLVERDSPFAGYDVSRFLRPVQWTYVASFLVILNIASLFKFTKD